MDTSGIKDVTDQLEVKNKITQKGPSDAPSWQRHFLSDNKSQASKVEFTGNRSSQFDWLLELDNPMPKHMQEQEEKKET